MAYAAAVRKQQVLPFFNFYTISAIFVLAFVYAYVLIQFIDEKSGLTHLMLLGLLQVTPFVLCFSRQHFNYVSFLGVNHFVTFTIPKYNEVKLIHKGEVFFPQAIHAIDELIICTALIYTAYFVSRFLFFYGFVEKKRYQLLCVNVYQLIFISCYVIFFPLILDYIPPFLGTIHFAALNAHMILMMSCYCPRYERLTGYIRMLCSLSTIYYFLIFGSLGLVGALATYVFTISCLTRQYKGFILLAFLTLVGTMIQSVKSDYRLLLTQADVAMAPLTLSERLSALSELLMTEYGVEDLPRETEQTLDDDDKEEIHGKEASDSLLNGFQRLSDDSMELVLTMTPSEVPFWNGETYDSMPYMFIPRALWPDKPSRHFWNKFGRLYGVLTPDDLSTSVAVSFLAEGYMNFGYTGMYSIALIFGLMVAAFERLGYYFLRGYFSFTFIVFLIPLMGFSYDFCTILNAEVIVLCTMFVFRSVLLKMARRDEYST